MSDQIYLIRPCRGSYMDKRGMRRWLKPNVVHGAYVIGPGSRERLSFTRKYTDIEVREEKMPKELVAYLQKLGAGTPCLPADKLRELGWRVPTIPASGYRRRRWFFWNDDGGMR